MKSILFSCSILVLLVTLFVGCSKKPSSVIEDFHDAKTWEEQKQFIYESEGLTEESISDFIFNNPNTKIAGIEEKKRMSDSIIIYKLKWTSGEYGGSEDYIVRLKNGEPKIDFKSMMGYNSIKFDQLLINRPKEGIFRVKLRRQSGLMEIVNPRFAEFFVYSIKSNTIPSNISFFVFKSSPMFQKLIELNEKNIVVKIEFDYTEGSDDIYGKITEIVKEDWLL